jgi:hypothetical protein
MNDADFDLVQSRLARMVAVTGAVGGTTCMRTSGSVGSPARCGWVGDEAVM